MRRAFFPGVRHGRTIGSPVSILLENRDWKNWQEALPVEPGDPQKHAIASDPRPETQQVRQFLRVENNSVDLANRFCHFGIDAGQCFKQRKPEIAQSGADLVSLTVGFNVTNFVSLPKCGNFSVDNLFASQSLPYGEGKTIQAFELFGNAATLQQNRLASHFRGMGCEYRRHHDLTKSRQRRVGRRLRPASFAITSRGKSRAAAYVADPVGPPCSTALAMVRLRQIREFEIDGEGLGHLISARQVHF